MAEDVTAARPNSLSPDSVRTATAQAAERARLAAEANSFPGMFFEFARNIREMMKTNGFSAGTNQALIKECQHAAIQAAHCPKPATSAPSDIPASPAASPATASTGKPTGGVEFFRSDRKPVDEAARAAALKRHEAKTSAEIAQSQAAAAARAASAPRE